MDVAAAAAVVGGYLLGSIDFGVVVPRVFGVDIYTTGSGNPGASNVLRTMGRGFAAVVLAGDILKGLGAAALGAAAGGDAVGFAAGCAAVVGHCYPLWHGFRGGKGVAAAGGMTIWLAPLIGAGMAAAWTALALATRKASIASLIVVAALVPALGLAGRRGWALVWAGVAGILIVTRHHQNIRRLLTGSEHEIEETPA